MIGTRPVRPTGELPTGYVTTIRDGSLGWRGVGYDTPHEGGNTMLVLTRKVGERIQVGDSIVVTVVRVQNDKVRIGIDAPADVAIVREEVLARLDRAGQTFRPRELSTTSEPTQH
jgi:carbon storage regulator